VIGESIATLGVTQLEGKHMSLAVLCRSRLKTIVITAFLLTAGTARAESLQQYLANYRNYLALTNQAAQTATDLANFNQAIYVEYLRYNSALTQNMNAFGVEKSQADILSAEARRIQGEVDRALETSATVSLSELNEKINRFNQSVANLRGSSLSISRLFGDLNRLGSPNVLAGAMPRLVSEPATLNTFLQAIASSTNAMRNANQALARFVNDRSVGAVVRALINDQRDLMNRQSAVVGQLQALVTGSQQLVGAINPLPNAFNGQLSFEQSFQASLAQSLSSGQAALEVYRVYLNTLSQLAAIDSASQSLKGSATRLISETLPVGKSRIEMLLVNSPQNIDLIQTEVSAFRAGVELLNRNKQDLTNLQNQLQRLNPTVNSLNSGVLAIYMREFAYLQAGVAYASSGLSTYAMLSPLYARYAQVLPGLNQARNDFDRLNNEIQSENSRTQDIIRQIERVVADFSSIESMPSRNAAVVEARNLVPLISGQISGIQTRTLRLNNLSNQLNQIAPSLDGLTLIASYHRSLLSMMNNTLGALSNLNSRSQASLDSLNSAIAAQIAILTPRCAGLFATPSTIVDGNFIQVRASTQGYVSTLTVGGREVSAYTSSEFSPAFGTTGVTGQIRGAGIFKDTVVDCPAAAVTVTLENPVRVSSASDFQMLRQNPSGNFILDSDIDLSASMLPEGFEFAGVLDGQGHRIKIGPGALFEVLSRTGVVQAITLEQIQAGSRDTAALAIVSRGRVLNSNFELYSGKTSVVGTNLQGGIISDCRVLVRAAASPNYAAAGVAQDNAGILNHVMVSGSLSSRYMSAGLVINNSGIIRYSGADVDLSGGYQASGLASQNSGVIEKSFARGSMRAGYGAAGIVFENSGQVRDSFATARLAGVYFAAGLVGYNRGFVVTSYASGPGPNQAGFTVAGVVAISTGGTVFNTYYDTTIAPLSQFGLALSPEQIRTRGFLLGFDYSLTWKQDQAVNGIPGSLPTLLGL
jgi:DNA repair exonuclease SbcCD ATPase subunit